MISNLILIILLECYGILHSAYLSFMFQMGVFRIQYKNFASTLPNQRNDVMK